MSLKNLSNLFGTNLSLTFEGKELWFKIPTNEQELSELILLLSMNGYVKVNNTPITPLEPEAENAEEYSEIDVDADAETQIDDESDNDGSSTVSLDSKGKEKAPEQINDSLLEAEVAGRPYNMSRFILGKTKTAEAAEAAEATEPVKPVEKDWNIPLNEKTFVKEYSTTYGRPYNTQDEDEFLKFEKTPYTTNFDVEFSEYLHNLAK